jgi:hypothetical protein
MAANSIQVPTPAFYRGLPVTVVGRVDEVLLAVAAYATPFELAVGVIASEDHGAGERYRVTGHDRAVATLDVAAGLAAHPREQRDRGERAGGGAGDSPSWLDPPPSGLLMGECPPCQAARASASRRWESARRLRASPDCARRVEADLPSNDELFWAWEIYQHTGDRRDLQLRVRALRRELKPIVRGYAGKAPRYNHARRDRTQLGIDATSSGRGQRCGRSPPSRACSRSTTTPNPRRNPALRSGYGHARASGCRGTRPLQPRTASARGAAGVIRRVV